MVQIDHPIRRRQAMPVEAVTTLVLCSLALLGFAGAVMSGYVPMPHI
jgi:hypothetical protein